MLVYQRVDYIETNLISVHESGPLSKSLPQYYNRPAMSDLNDGGMPPFVFLNFHLHPPETGFVCKE